VCDLTPQARTILEAMSSGSKRRDRQVVRILGILGALLEDGRPSVHELARRFGTRRETIYRDLRALEDAGYPVVGDEGGHLSRPQLLTDRRRTPQVRFTPEEISALDWAAAQASAGPFSEVLDGARQKLQAISAALGQEAAGVARVTDSWGPTAPPTAPEVLLRLAEAILRRRTCRGHIPNAGRHRAENVRLSSLSPAERRWCVLLRREGAAPRWPHDARSPPRRRSRTPV